MEGRGLNCWWWGSLLGGWEGESQFFWKYAGSPTRFGSVRFWFSLVGAIGLQLSWARVRGGQVGVLTRSDSWGLTGSASAVVRKGYDLRRPNNCVK